MIDTFDGRKETPEEEEEREIEEAEEHQIRL